MFTVNEYKIVFKRRWHCYYPDGTAPGITKGDGRYDTVCEIWISGLEVPRFTGVAKLHPNDQPDKIVGKKIALQNAIGLVKVEGQPFLHFSTLQQQDAFCKEEVRTAIWKAFWDWVATWPKKSKIDVRQIVTKYLKDNGYDGLYAEGCACFINDIVPCGYESGAFSCEPGYKSPCDPKTCPEKCGGWHIGPKQLHNDKTETNKTKGGG